MEEIIDVELDQEPEDIEVDNSTELLMSPIEILKIEVYTDSAKIFLKPVLGAKDYAIFNIDKPNLIKFSGGNTSIDVNGLQTGTVNKYVIQALDDFGPYMSMKECMEHMKDSIHICYINGHGPVTNKPKVLSETRDIQIKVSTYIPDPNAIFQDTFNDSTTESFKVVNKDPVLGDKKLYKQLENSKWKIGFYKCDLKNSQVFIDKTHLMTDVYDFNKTSYASISLIPKQKIDMSSGKYMKLSFNVDTHFPPTMRRWIDIVVMPFGDILQRAGSQAKSEFPLTASGKVVCITWLYKKVITKFWRITEGFSGWVKTMATNRNNPDQSYLDNKVKIDFFFNGASIRVFEDNKMIHQSLVEPGYFEGKPLQVGVIHTLYHSTLEHNQICNTPKLSEEESYYKEYYKNNDMRHWDDFRIGYTTTPNL